MMLIAIMRHAKAEKESQTGRDADRRLTPRGQRQAAALGDRVLSIARGRRTRIIASPATRTRDTAGAIARACDLDAAFDDRLVVDSPVAGAVELAEQHAREGGAEVLVLVGHNDQISDLAAILVAGPRALVGENRDAVAPLRTGEGVLLDAPNRGDTGASLIGVCNLVGEWRRDDDAPEM